MTDRELDRFLDELEAPPPSDLLRARLHNAAAKAKGGPAAVPTGARPLGPRAGFYGRVAAALALAALVGLGAWLPGPGPARDAGMVQSASPVVPAPWYAAANDIGPDSGAADGGPSLSLVGGGEAAIGGVGLVQAGWSQASAADAAGEEVGELDEIPLD